MAALGPSSTPNPRKFSEKIALQQQRQAEETAAFEEVMMDIGSARLQAQKLRLNCRGLYYGGSLPNVNQIGSSTSEFQGTLHSALDSARSTRHHGLVERVQRDPRRMMSPLRRYMRHLDSSPYGSAYLSPPPEPSWRRNVPWGNFSLEKGQLFRLPSALNRTNSDSALHTSVMNPSSKDTYHGPALGITAPKKKVGFLDRETESKGFLFPVPAIEEDLLNESRQLLKPWDTRKLPPSSSQPRSCEVPDLNVYPSLDQHVSVPVIPPALNTGGSLPDLTSLHFPSPLPTPLDPEESVFPCLSAERSTTNLSNALPELGLRNTLGLAASYHSSGLMSPTQNSLSNPCLQSSLRNQPLSSSASNPSLSTQSMQCSSTTSNFTSSSYPPTVNPLALAANSTSPRRRMPLGPLTLPLGEDSRRPHSKQFSPTLSPTLSSITQGVPLDTSKLPAEQRLPLYSCKPSLQLQPQQPLKESQPQGTEQSLHKTTSTQQDNTTPCYHHPSMQQYNSQPEGAIHLGNFEQFNMVENQTGWLMLNNNPCIEQSGTFHYQQEDNLTLVGSHSLINPPLLTKQKRSNCNGHGLVPDIILTAGDAPLSGFSKEITSALAGLPGFEVDPSLGLDEDLKIEPLTLDGLNILRDPYAFLTDPTVEDSFHTDCL